MRQPGPYIPEEHKACMRESCSCMDHLTHPICDAFHGGVRCHQQQGARTQHLAVCAVVRVLWCLARCRCAFCAYIGHNCTEPRKSSDVSCYSCVIRRACFPAVSRAVVEKGPTDLKPVGIGQFKQPRPPLGRIFALLIPVCVELQQDGQAH